MSERKPGTGGLEANATSSVRRPDLGPDVEIDVASLDLEDDAAEKEASAPVISTPEMLLLSPNLGRERDGAETEVEPEMGFGDSLRRVPVPPSIIDLAEGSVDKRGAFLVDDPSLDYEPLLPSLTEGEGLVPPPPPECGAPGTRSASVSNAEDGSGESARRESMTQIEQRSLL